MNLVSSTLMLALLAGLAACSPLRTFNTLVPKDGGVRMAARGAGASHGP
jgi:hypothetical protein